MIFRKETPQGRMTEANVLVNSSRNVCMCFSELDNSTCRP